MLFRDLSRPASDFSWAVDIISLADALHSFHLETDAV